MTEDGSKYSTMMLEVKKTHPHSAKNGHADDESYAIDVHCLVVILGISVLPLDEATLHGKRTYKSTEGARNLLASDGTTENGSML